MIASLSMQLFTVLLIIGKAVTKQSGSLFFCNKKLTKISQFEQERMPPKRGKSGKNVKIDNNL